MSPLLPSLALGLLAVACSTGTQMEIQPQDSRSDAHPPMVQHATFAAG